MAASLPARIQAWLASFYGIEHGPSVDDFVEPVDEGEGREELVVRDGQDEIELALRLPRAAVEAGREPSFDELCQTIEGVSHFLYLVERARCDLSVTQLELELQAEVDKYVAFALVKNDGEGPRYEPMRSWSIRVRLFERVTYLHPAGTEQGDRYRMANKLAARLAGRLEANFARHGRFEQMHATLRRFYRVGQAGKIALAYAA